MSNVLRMVAASILVAVYCTGAAAAEPSRDVIAKITGVEPEAKDGVVTIRVPRTDLAVVVAGVKITPFQGLTSWAAFTAAGDETVVMGDLTLTEDEVSAAMSAALDHGLEVTALHNHFLYDRPRIFFMHIGGRGTTEQLATGVAKALQAAKASGAHPASANAAPSPGTGGIDAAPLERVFGQAGQAKDGMVKFVFGKTTAMHGLTAGAAMGVNTWAAFAGSPASAVVDGDFAMLEDELQGVLKALRRANIDVVAIHNHMTHEQPRIVFLHFWGRGAAEALARGIRAALDTQAPPRS